MIFNTLYESSQRGELMLIDGGFCHFHLRRDGQLTIREIISQRPGAGQEMLKRLCATPGATSLFAKCPAELPANDWYQRRGFEFEGEERTRSGRVLSLWRLPLPLPASPSARVCWYTGEWLSMIGVGEVVQLVVSGRVGVEYHE